MVDALYFVRRDGAFVFTEGYLHPRGGLMGKVMLFPDPKGEVDIFGRRFRSSDKRLKDGKIELIPHGEQLAVQFEFTPSLSRAPRPAYEKYHVEFPLSDFIGVFEHGHSLARYFDPDDAGALALILEELWEESAPPPDGRRVHREYLAAQRAFAAAFLKIAEGAVLP